MGMNWTVTFTKGWQRRSIENLIHKCEHFSHEFCMESIISFSRYLEIIIFILFDELLAANDDLSSCISKVT